MKLTFGRKPIDILRAKTLFIRGGVEHREADDLAILGIESTEGENGFGITAGNQDQSSLFRE